MEGSKGIHYLHVGKCIWMMRALLCKSENHSIVQQ
jgi:hypothetical protein